MNYLERYIAEQMDAANQKRLFQVNDSTFSFPDSGNTFTQWEARPYGQWVIFCPDYNTTEEVCRHFFGTLNNIDDTTRGVTRWRAGGGGPIVIGVFDGQARTLVHESVHAAMQVLGRAGVKVTADNDEALAYLLHSIYEAFEGMVVS